MDEDERRSKDKKNFTPLAGAEDDPKDIIRRQLDKLEAMKKDLVANEDYIGAQRVKEKAKKLEHALQALQAIDEEEEKEKEQEKEKEKG